MVARLRLLTGELERPGQHSRHGGGPDARARARVLPGRVVRSGRRAGPGPAKVGAARRRGAGGEAGAAAPGARVHTAAGSAPGRSEPDPSPGKSLPRSSLTFLLSETGKWKLPPRLAVVTKGDSRYYGEAPVVK